MRKRKIILRLNGGFGNQLFQLGVALSHLEENDTLILDLTLFEKSNREPIVRYFTIDCDYQIIEKRNLIGYLLDKLLNIELMAKINPLTHNRVLSKLGKPILKILLRINYSDNVKIIAPHDLGYEKIAVDRDSSILFLGYFQSAFYINDLAFKLLMSIKPRVESEYFREHLKTVADQKPIVIHSRQTDYLSEKDFGVLSSNYYTNILNKLENKSNPPIWIFSDDTSGLKNWFPNHDKLQIFFFDESLLSDAQVFHIMRLGSEFYIANSSFSFWAAFLRFDSRAPVYYPTPWFKNAKAPASLTPHEWIELPSDFI